MEKISDKLTTYNFSSLEDIIEFEINGVIEKELVTAYCPKTFLLCATCLDYTTLKVSDTEKSVSFFVGDLLKKLKKHKLPEVASVCVFPQFSQVTQQELADTKIKTSVVCGGFPTGQTFHDIKLAECRTAQAVGAKEIDVVIPVGDILEKNYDKVYRELVDIRKACSEEVILKVIVESGELKDIEYIFNATLIAAYAGADFIKTSTGKVPVNATPEAVYVICEALRQFHQQTGKMVGVKVSGGITKLQNAIRYLTIVKHVLGEAWGNPQYFRIGASQLLDDIIKEMNSKPVGKI